MLKNKLLLLLAAYSTYLYSFHVNAMHNGQSDNIIILNPNESSLELTDYEPFAPDFLYNKDFLDNPETLKVAKKEAITLRLQQKYTETLPYLEEAIKHGDLTSMMWLGEYYEQEGDLLKAIQWYILAFQLHWLETFKHHPKILKKFETIKEKYTILKHRNKIKTNAIVEFNDYFYELPINEIDKKEIKQFLYELVTPGPVNFLNFYTIDLDESAFETYLYNIHTYIEENKDSLKSQHIKKIFLKIRQTLYQKKLKIYSKSNNTITLESKNDINKLHHMLGIQYYYKKVLNINNTPNYTKAAKHLLLSQNEDAHDILYDLYLNKDADFQSILNSIKDNQSYEKVKNSIHELSIQENIDHYYEKLINKFKESKIFLELIKISHLYDEYKTEKNLDKNTKNIIKENTIYMQNILFNYFDQQEHSLNYFYKGYTFYFFGEYEAARTNFLLALEKKIKFDTSIIDLIDTHIESKEHLKNLEQENNKIEDIPQSTPSIINNSDTYEEFSKHLIEEEFSTKNLPPDLITKSFKKGISTKESKRLLKINKLNYKIKKNFEKIEKYQKKFEEKQKKYGIFLDENISTQEFKKRKILFSSDSKPISNKQKEIKQQYEYLINENDKFQRLIEDVKINPWSGGEGQVEHLKRRGSYSRRINHCDRLEYRINSDGDIIILAVEGHYND
jgi:Txe/YoeB family toxin of Txe-Axe toxin-antitoxin module